MALEFSDDIIRQIFGHEAAEDETLERLMAYYFKSSVYSRIQSASPLKILIGHKGIGKSALLSVAHAEDKRNGNYSIFLRPDNITSIPAESRDTNEIIRAWKSGLLNIIRNKVLQIILNVDVDDFASSTTYSWSTFFSGLSEIAKNFFNTKGLNFGKMQEDALNSFASQQQINIYIDDLDRGWNASEESIVRMSALLNALRDISRDFTGIHFIISIRADVFYLIRTSDESTDKLESSCIWFSWDNHEILAMLIKRIRSFFGEESIDDQELVSMQQKDLAKDLDLVMDNYFNGRGKWEHIPTYRMLMTLIRRRPRDLVKLCTLAARKAFDNKHNKISSGDFNSIFERYSLDRLQDTINEYKTELPNIQALLENMKATTSEIRLWKDGKKDKLSNYKTDELTIKLQNILLNHNLHFYGKHAKASPQELIAFMYKIGFITANKILETGEIDRKYFDEQNYISSKFSDFGYDWEIHPAYRWALNPAEQDPLSSFEPSP